MERHDVHLSAETKVTVQVGGRHGKPALLTIRAGDMHRAGFVFRCSANGVSLGDHVPPQFIEFVTEGRSASSIAPQTTSPTNWSRPLPRSSTRSECTALDP